MDNKKKLEPLMEDFNIIISPIITEKTMFLSKKKQITFKVKSNANKIAIKKSIERLFNVKILGISIINVHPKTKSRGGRYKGKTNSYKKAIINLDSNSNIDFFDEGKK